MLRTEFYERLHNGENSGVEFKRDDVRPDSLAKEIAALANLEGGVIFLGVEDDGTVSGLTRSPAEAEEWVMNICRDHLQPPMIPFWEVLKLEEGGPVGIITIPDDAPDIPYKARRASAWVTFVRVGSTSREASREEEVRLYQRSGWMRHDIRPVPGTTLDDLDLRRLRSYFEVIRRQTAPARADDTNDLAREHAEWEPLLVNTDIMLRDRGRAIPTVGGLLLFGFRPNRALPQAGITATAFPGIEKDYAARERVSLRGPMTPLLDFEGKVVENGLIDQAMQFVLRNMSVQSSILENGRRVDWTEYPLEAVREAIVNAVVHRDYTISVTDIELSLYSDRLEVISPGKLPNTVTVEKMRAGYRATRNELIKEILRDYHYVEANGLGVPRKIVAGMRRHNGTDPDLVEEEDRFTVRLYKGVGHTMEAST